MTGTRRVVVQTDQPLPLLSWRDEIREIPHVWPQLAPQWLAATGDAARRWTPRHTLAQRGRGEWALLPGFVFTEPESPAADPGSHHIHDSAFPVLLLGSPLGRCSDVAYSFWTPRLYESLVHAALADARDAGVRSVLAPWIPDRQGSDDLRRAMVDSGAHAVSGGLMAHAAPPSTLPSDADVHADGDVTMFDASTLHNVLPQVCELIAAFPTATTGQPQAVRTLLGRLAEADVDLCGAITYHDGRPTAACVAVHKSQHLFVPFVAAPDPGERDTCLRAMLAGRLGADAPILRSVELSEPLGDSAVLPAARPRELTTALLVLDDSARPQAYAALDESAHTPAAT
jgi:hypothetical protein